MTDPIDKPYFPASEPGAQQEGVDAPGFFSATSDFMNGGVYNGTFRLGPPQSASNTVRGCCSPKTGTSRDSGV